MNFKKVWMCIFTQLTEYIKSSYTITYNNLKINYFSNCVCLHMPQHVWRSEDNLKELVLSYVVGPGIELKLSELVAAGKPSCWLEK